MRDSRAERFPEGHRAQTCQAERQEGTGLRRVRIATDSIADVPAALVSEMDIAVVPCQVFWGEQVYRDGVDLEPHQFYDRLAGSPELPRTSQPPMGLFVDTYQRLLDAENSEAVVSIHVAGNLSGTVNAAWAAAQTLADPSRVEVVDSGMVSMGIGWAVIEAARLAQTGATRAQISAAVRDMLPRLRAAAMIDTLENLYKGGRISQITATVGTVLQVKPLIIIQDGRVEVVDKVRTRSRALKRLESMVRDWGPLAQVAVLYTGAEKLAQDLASLLQDLAPGRSILVEPAGSALTTHLGLGAVGVCALVAAKSSL
jgi:DegV family protein with EDD domain